MVPLIAAAALVGGCGAHAKPGQGRTAPRPRLAISLGGFNDLVLGQRLKLAGGSSSGDVGPIVISADPAPFGRYRRIATKHLDRNRTLVFPVRPDRNTHYKFETPRVGGGRVLHIFVSPRTKLIPVLLGPDRARLTNTAKVRPGARVRLPRVFFYFHRRDVRRYRLLGSAQAVKAGRDTVRAQLDFTLSAASLALIPPRAG